MENAFAVAYVGFEAARPLRNLGSKESAMKTMRMLTLAALILFGAAHSSLSGNPAPAGVQNADPLAGRIDALLAEAYPPDKPGAVSLVVRDGKVLFQKAYGLADLELGVPMSPDTVFACGSMTKMFTATAVMMLAETRALRYGDLISKYFPEAPPAWARITVDHVLSHTSGLLDLFKIPEWMAQWKEEISPKALIAFFMDKPLQFEPGAKAEYCNSNYAVLGQIVEKVSGKPLEQFVKERIIQPLDMQATRFFIGLEEIIPHRAKSYLIYPDGSLKNPPFMIPWSQAYGAGTVHSTVGDIAKFVTALFNGRLLKPESLINVTTPRMMKDGKPSPYGYGNLFVFAGGTAPMIRISGSTIGTEVFSVYLKDEKALVAVFSNVATYLPETPNPYFPGPLVKKIALMLAEKQ
jgi:CubicO group peptidase (beta-lactamase class C family)